jgi:hypothetical protein
MSGQSESTQGDVQAARRVVAHTTWDEAIVAVLDSPDFQALRSMLSAPTRPERRGRDWQREAAHQEVVQFVQQCQEAR